MIKKFKTHEEQLEILRLKGLIIDEDSINVLRRNNYYFLINRYRNPFINNTKPVTFKSGASFNEILALCEFDRNIRNAFFKYILNVENVLKSILSYEFSLKYGYEYLNKDSFDNVSEKYLNDLFNNINQAIKTGIKENEYMNHYDKNYSKFPLWVIVNNFSLGVTIKFYRNLKECDRSLISSKFNLEENTLLEYLFTINYFRNQIAHNQRFYDLNYNGVNTKELINILSNLLSKKEIKELKEEIEIEIKKLDESINSITISDILGGYLL